MAGPYPQGFIESVRNAGDIVHLVSDYVPLKPGGSRLKGLCPFHTEKTPSFSVDPKLQLFYCFGCQTGGDIFKFLMLYESVSFSEAVETLANRFGVPLPEAGGGRRPESAYDRLLQMNRAAQDFFRSRLSDGEGAAQCRDYLKRRRIEDVTRERLGIGFAPAGWEALRNHLLAKRFKAQEMLQGGLVSKRKSGTGEYDRFRNRVMFPIRDVNGRTVAFGGRTLGDDPPKYINSPETPCYKKGEHLYGLDIARDAIRREGFAVVVEGYLDLSAVSGAGIDNVVATLGTAFTPQQARLLARYTTRVIFSYDGDAAGATATARSLDMLLAKGFEVRVVDLPAGQDPDDYIGEHGAEVYDRLLRKSPDYLEFLIRRETNSRDLSRAGEKVAAINVVLPHVAKLTSPVARATWVGRIAEALRVEDALVMQELRGAVKSAAPGIRQRPQTTGRALEAEMRLVHQLLTSEEERQRWATELDLNDLNGSEVRPIVQAIVELTRTGHEVNYPVVFEAVEDADQRDLLTRIAFREEPEEGPSVEDCLWAFRRQKLARQGRLVRREINDLQHQSVSDEEVDRQLLRLQQLARERDAILNCEDP